MPHLSLISSRLPRLFLATLCLALGSSNVFGYWEQIFSLTNNATLFCMGENTFRVFAGTTNGIVWTDDRYKPWTVSDDSRAIKDVRSMGVFGYVVLAGTTGNGMFRSTDNGRGWTKADSGLPPASSVYAIAGNLENYFIAIDGAVYVSKDTGQSWSPSGDGLSGWPVITLAANNSFIYASTFTDGVFRSEDQGKSWVSANEGLPAGTFIRAFRVNTDTIYAGGGGGLFASEDQGKHWHSDSKGIPANTDVYSFTQRGEVMLTGTNQGVFSRLHGTESWTNVNENLGTNLAYSILSDGVYFYAGVLGLGVFRATYTDVLGIRDRVAPSGHFGFMDDLGSLLHPGSRIDFSIAAPGWVDLELFDAKGHRFLSLVHSNLAAGSHRAELGSTSMPAGFYFLKLQSRGKTLMRRVVIAE